MSTHNAYQSPHDSDIFNQQKKPIDIEKAHKRNVFKIKTDVFNQSQADINAKLRSQHNKSQSDIFFKIPIKTKPDQSDRRNMSNRSIVFSHLNSKDYVVTREKNDKPFKPNKVIREITPVKRRLNELYSQDELNYSDVNSSTCSLTSKGYLKKEEESYHPIKKLRVCANRRKCIWEMEKNNNEQFKTMNDTTSKGKKIRDMRSNIFNDQGKQMSNSNHANSSMIELNRMVLCEDGIGNGHLSTQPKKIPHSKWVNKLDWKSPKTELLFKNANDKEEANLSAFQRKHNQLYGSIPISNHNSNSNGSSQTEKESIVFYISDDYKRQDKHRRISDNVSSSLLSNSGSFYEKTMQYSLNNPIEHEYQIKEAKMLEPKDIQKLFEQKGIQVYNILDNTSTIFGKTSYRFKIRENDTKGNDLAFSEICEALKKERGVDILPIKKITVNKKKPYEVQLPTDRLFPDEILKNNVVVVNGNQAKDRVKGGTKYKKKFTQEFNTINNSYKNNGLRRNGNMTHTIDY